MHKCRAGAFVGLIFQKRMSHTAFVQIKVDKSRNNFTISVAKMTEVDLITRPQHCRESLQCFCCVN